MTHDTITKTVFFSVSREVVWSYLTVKDRLAEWFHPAAADLSANEDYALMESGESGLANKVCWGRVLHWEPHVKLAYSFTVKPLNGAMTTVTWILEDVAGGTRLTLVHEGLAEAVGASAIDLLKALDKGWDEHFGKLRPIMARPVAA
ncbi:MAG: SRPBCC family protein [Hyphomicrobiaceae bacterium]